MKKTFILLLLLSLSVQFVLAQPTQVEIQKKMDEAMKKAEQFTNDPNVKAAIEKAKQMSQQPVNVPVINDSKNNPSKPDRRILPAKNSKLLSQLPKKILTNNQLSTYLQTLNTQLWQKIISSSADSARITASQFGNDGERLSGAAMVAWYKNDAEAAVLLAIKAATLSSDDNTSLNNCAALLSMAGLENKAIPVLHVLLQREPNSSTVLNNLGQAYTSMGEVDSAMFYFGRCIKIAPAHPEANNTAAIISMRKGQTEAAKKYCLQALKGGLSSEARKTYLHLFPRDDIYKLVDEKPFRSYPFNEHDFIFPEQCETIDNAVRINTKLKALATMYRAMNDKLQKGYVAENMSKAQGLANKFGKNPMDNLDLANSETLFTRRAEYAFAKITIPLSLEIADLTTKHGTEVFKLESENRAKKDELYRNQSAESRACDQNNLCQTKVVAKYCRLYNELSNQYLPVFAVINRDYVKKLWRLHKEMFEAYSVYARVAIRPGTILKAAKEAERMSLILSPLINGVILDNGYKIIYRDLICGNMTDKELKRIEELEIKENYKCNLNVEIPLGVAKMTFSCDEFELEGGELIKAKFNKNFRSGQTTLYAGVGVGATIPGFEASATQYVYVCFDKTNKPVDGGSQGELELDVKGVVKGDQKIILRTSVNTGVKFEPGPLQPLTDVLPYAFK